MPGGRIHLCVSPAFLDYVDLAAFCAAFFWRRGNRDLFFFTSFGTFGFGGVALTAVTGALSGTSSFGSFFFAI